MQTPARERQAGINLPATSRQPSLEWANGTADGTASCDQVNSRLASAVLEPRLKVKCNLSSYMGFYKADQQPGHKFKLSNGYFSAA